MINLNTSVILLLNFWKLHGFATSYYSIISPSQFKGFEKLTYMTLPKLNESFTRIGGLYQSGFLIKTSKGRD